MNQNEPFTPYLPIVLTELDRADNLILHCVLVLSQTYDATTGYPPEKPKKSHAITPRTESIGPDLEKHYRSLEQVMYLLAPDVEISPCAFSSSKRADFICAFRRIALEARLKSSKPRLRKATNLMEEALAKFPYALTSYTLEVAPAIPAKAQLSRLARLVAKAGKGSSLAQQSALRIAADTLLAFGATPVTLEAPLERSISTTLPKKSPPIMPMVALSPVKNAQHIQPMPSSQFLTFLTRRQRTILDYCTSLAQIFFDTERKPSPIKPRLYPLLCAPTGAGKSALVKEIAHRINAHYLRIQRGDFVPQHTKTRSTLFQLLDTLVAQPRRRMICHLDELDKYVVAAGGAAPVQEWSAGIWNDIFLLVEGAAELPYEDYLLWPDRVKPQDSDPITVASLRKAVEQRLFLIGSGTWQAVFAKSCEPTIGFTISEPSEVTAADIVNSNQVSPELLARFHSRLQIMTYPEHDEILQLLEATGIKELADKLEYRLQKQDLDFTRGGFRVLETLYTRLLMIEQTVVPVHPGILDPHS